MTQEEFWYICFRQGEWSEAYRLAEANRKYNKQKEEKRRWREAKVKEMVKK